MLIFEIAHMPSVINNMADGALKRLSAAVGYNMACYSQEEVEKQLPKYESTEPKQTALQALQDRMVSGTQSQVQNPPKPETLASVDILKSAIEQKENLPSAKIAPPLSQKLHNKPLKIRGKISARDKYRTESQSLRKQHRSEILRKIREGEVRRNSWRPYQILKNRWAKMSQKERKAFIDKIDHLVTTGAIKTCDWLVWNVPKLGIRAMYMMMAGEVPEYASDAMKMCDLMRDMDKL